MDEYTRTPMRSYETKSLQYLLGLAQEAEHALTVLESRLKTVGAWEKLKCAAKDVADAAAEVMKTVPANKLMTLKRNLANLEMTIRVKNVVGSGEKDSFCSVETGLLRDVLMEYAKEKCGLCFGTVHDMKNCRYRELLEAIVMEDVEDSPYGCKYRFAEWDNE